MNRAWARDPALSERWHLYPGGDDCHCGVVAEGYNAPCGCLVRRGGPVMHPPDPRLLPGGACQHCLIVAGIDVPRVSIDDLTGAHRAGRAAFLAKQPITSMPDGMPENAWKNGWRDACRDWLETDEGAAFMELVFQPEGP